MNDRILLSLVISLLIIWAAFGIAGPIWNWWKRRSALRDIRDRRVPADYDQVGLIAKELNNSIIATGSEDEAMLAAVMNVRQSVGRIRGAGYDKARLNVRRLVPVKDGVLENPWEKGSGEAKQWVRGYCMGANEKDPKQWMDKA